MFKMVLAVLLANPLLLSALDLNHKPTLRQFLTQVAEKQKQNRLREMAYLYELRRHRIILDGKGREKKRRSSTYEFIPLADGVYRKLIKKNGQPLSEKEARKQQKKAEARLSQQKNLSPLARAKLERKRSERRRKTARFWDEAAQAFHFQYRGEEVLTERTVAVVDLRPREEYKPSEKDFRVLAKLKGRIWIDKQDLQIVQAEMEFIEALKIAGGLVAKLHKGSTLWVQQQKVQDEVWFPRQFELKMSGRILLLKGFNIKLTGDFSNYRRFGTSVRLFPADPPSTEASPGNVETLAP